MQYEANVEAYNLPENGKRLLRDRFGGTYGFSPVCWTDGKPGVLVGFPISGATPDEATARAGTHFQMACGRLGIGLEGVEVTVEVHPRPERDLHGLTG
jgi:hypothetical protein